MIDLRQFDPLPTTTEGLSALMLDFRVKSARQQVDYNPVSLEIANRLEEFNDMDPAAQKYCNEIKGLFGAEGLVGILAYQHLREHIETYQKQNGISGVKIISETVAGQHFSYPNWDEQLALLGSDISVLKSAVPMVVEYFQRLAKSLPEYRLVREVWDSEGDERQWDPSTLSEVQTFSQMAGMAWIHTESTEWKPPNDKGEIWGHHIDRDPPDQIHLIFRLGHPDSEDQISFILAGRSVQ